MTVFRSSMIMASGTVVSRILGLVRTVLLAYAIGVTTNVADAFGVANQLPNNVYAIVVGGLLNAVLVPQIVRARVRKDGGKQYIDGLLTVIISVFAVLTILATAAAPLLVRLYTTGWDQQTLALATAFAYWCLPQLFFYGLYSILGEVLNARSSFGPYMWAPVLNNVVAIAGLGVFIGLFGPSSMGSVDQWGSGSISILAGTATAGVASQALILFFFWKRIGLRFTFNFKLRGLGLRPALKAAGWTLAMLTITQLGGLIQTNLTSSTLAARAGETNGSLASVAVSGTAWLIFMIPHSVGTVSIVTAYFTRISKHAHDHDWDKLRTDVIQAIRSILFLSLIASALIIVLCMPIARVFALQYQPSVALATVLVAMTIGLVPFSINFMLQRVFYALEDTKSPFVFTTIQILVFVSGAFLASKFISAIYLVAAISLAMSLSFVIQAALSYRLLSKKIGHIFNAKLTRYWLQVFGAAIVAGIIAIITVWVLGGVGEQSFALSSTAGALVTSLAAGTTGVLTYLVILNALGNHELTSVWKKFKGIARR